MTNGEKLKAVLNPRANQIKILGNWVEIEIQKLGINFSCGLDWWNTEYKEPTTKNDLSSGLENVSPIIDWNKCHTSEQLNSIATTKNDLGVDYISRKQPEVTPTTIHAAWKDGSFLHTKLVDKKGYTKIGECYCSNCRSYLDFSDNYRVPGRYCPWCGAKMEEIE